MIRKCFASDFERIFEIINDAAHAYKRIIPAEYWKEPYMSRDELKHELDEGIEMWGYEENGELTGVMGIQHRQNVTLIRHAYVSTSRQNQGIGGKLLSHLIELTSIGHRLRSFIGLFANVFGYKQPPKHYKLNY